jgi:membrane associated rhomboid family serine protease
MKNLRRPFRYSYTQVVFYLIGINVLIYLAQHFFKRIGPFNIPLTYYLAMIPDLVLNGWVWQFVTYMFVHDPQRWSHLIFNMLGLFIFGIQVERRMGSKEFLLYYFITGTLAGVISFAAYYFTRTPAILLGASGAIFAVELAFATFFPDAIIYIWGIIPLRAPVMVLGFTALELIFSVTGMQGNVAHLTHLSGFAVGWLYFLIRFRINPWREFRRYR